MVQDLENEIWKPVKGYEWKYEISNLGRVKSLFTGLLLKPARQSNGYYSLFLSKNGKKKSFYLHRLVYEAFHGSIPKWEATAKGDERLEINHKDEDPSNNCLDNLELVTCRQNNNYGTHNERSGKNREKKVYQYNSDYELVGIWDSTKKSVSGGFNQGAVSACCRGKKLKYKGFIWSFIPLEKGV